MSSILWQSLSRRQPRHHSLAVSITLTDTRFRSSTGGSIVVGLQTSESRHDLHKLTDSTWGVPLHSFQLNESLAQASHISQVFHGNRSLLLNGQELEYLEIGNEANYWGLPSWWNAKNYTETFNRYGEAISAVLPFAQGKTELLAGSFTGSAGSYPWSALGTMGYGIFSDPDVGKVVGGWSQHKYYGQNDGQEARVGGMMGKAGVRGNMASLFVDVQAVRSAGRKYVLVSLRSRPTASLANRAANGCCVIRVRAPVRVTNLAKVILTIQGETNTFSNHGLPGQSNTAESVIFAVDQMLYGATIGISRQYFHNGVGYLYSALCPSGSVDDGYGLNRPHIGALYHAYLIVNEAIGQSGSAHVAEIATSDNRIAAYGIWEDGWLARAVLIDSEPYTREQNGGNRKNATVFLDNKASEQGRVRWFETEYTNSTRGMTWAGQNFDTADGKPEGEVKETEWTGGVVVMPATSIAIVSFW